jgi:hypothetical protein
MKNVKRKMENRSAAFRFDFFIFHFAFLKTLAAKFPPACFRSQAARALPEAGPI